MVEEEDRYERPMRTYEVAGVTVTNIKLEQSSMREVTSGSLPDRVPVTALAQLLASHAVVAVVETTP
jgi:hypothetical protein